MKDCVITMRNVDGTQYYMRGCWASDRIDAQRLTFHEASRIARRIKKRSERWKGDWEIRPYQVTVRRAGIVTQAQIEERRQIDEEFQQQLDELYGDQAR